MKKWLAIIASLVLAISLIWGSACAPATDEGVTEIGGRYPVNMSGGLISKGEPVGASHLGQIFELVCQLRGNAGERQVSNARVGLGHVLGAGGKCAVTILKQ